MKITHKLILGCWLLTVCVWLAGYFSSTIGKKELTRTIIEHDVSLAHEMLARIDQMIYTRVETFQEYAHDVLLRNGIEESNAAFARLDDIEKHIDARESRWATLQGGPENPAIGALLQNEISEELGEKREFFRNKYGYDLFSEVFATNKYGAVAGMTDKTTDYRQDDEEWWQEAKRTGLYVSDIQYDKNADVYAIDICVRIEDNTKKFLGVLKAVYNVREIIQLLKERNRPKDTDELDYFLFTRDGKIIYSSAHEFDFLADVSEKEFFQNISGEKGHFFAQGYGHHLDQERLHIFVHSQGYRDFSGLGWILLAEHDQDEVFAPAEKLKKKMYSLSIAVTVFAVLISILVFHLISDPLRKLKTAVEALSKGELGEQVDIHSNDEIGHLAASFNQMSLDLQETTVSRDLLQKALDDVKTLSGIVPICMYCKQIRDDEGYWKQLEEFISEHSEATFSHGICDKCYKKELSELAKKQKDNQSMS